MKQRILISGILWAAIGSWLLYKGFTLLPSLLSLLALPIGFLKGRFVLSKTAARTIAHIERTNTYPRSTLIIILFMMSLGFLLRLIPTPVRGFIDIAVGFALLIGSLTYFTYGSRSLSESP